jgi:hypothetical protein
MLKWIQERPLQNVPHGSLKRRVLIQKNIANASALIMLETWRKAGGDG